MLSLFNNLRILYESVLDKTKLFKKDMQVLILEKDEQYIETIKNELKKIDLSFELSLVTNQVDFEASLMNGLPDVILSGVCSTYNSQELLQAVKTDYPYIPFILLIEDASEEIALNAMSMGADDYIFKDRLYRLPFALSNAVEKHRWKRECLQVRQDISQGRTLFSTIVDSSDDAIISKTLDGIITSWNKGAETIFGYTADEVIGKNISILIPSQHLNEEPDILEQIKNGKHVHHYETKRQRKDGSLVTISLSVSPIKDIDGNITGASKIARDITLQKEAEEKNLFKANLLKTIGQAVVATDLTGSIVYWNTAAEKMYGWKAEEVTGRKLADVQATDQSKEEANEIITELMKDNVWTGDFSVQRKDGKEFRVFAVGSAIKDQNGKVTGIISVTTDISELRKYEKEIEDYKHALDQSAIVAITDHRGIIKHVNQNFCNISRYSKEELIGKDHRIINSGYHSKEFIRNLWTTISNGRIWHGELKNVAKDGSIYWVDSTIVPFLDDKGKPFQYIAIRSDITKRKLAEDAIKESEIQYRSIVETAQEGILTTDKNQITNFANSRMCEMLECSTEEIIGKSVYEFISEEDKHNVGEIISGLKNNVNQSFEFKLATKKGKDLFVSVSSNPLFSEDNVYQGAMAMMTDITARKKSEEELRISQSNLRTIIENADSAIYSIDRNFRYITFNQRFKEILKEIYDVELKAGDKVSDLEDESDPRRQRIVKEWLDIYSNALEGNITKFEKSFKINDHIIYFSFSFHPIRENDNIIGLSCFATDITVQKQSENALMQSKTALAELNEQLRSLTAYLQTVREEERKNIAREVHDELGQQMTSLKMEIAWVNSMAGNDFPEIKDRTDKMMVTVKEAISSIRKIVIQLRPGILDDLGLEAALEWQSKEFQKNTGISCNFTSVVKQEEFSTEINTAVFRIFQESLTNVLRYAEATEVYANLYEKDNILMLDIEDNGIGIQEERKNHKTSFGIMGMKERAAMLKGSFDIQKSGDKGTIVQLKIPI